MYQRILVPIDGSATAERALQEAIKLAAGKASLRLVYVLDATLVFNVESYDIINYAALMQAVRQTGENALARAAEIVRQANMTAETALLESAGTRVATAIDREAKDWSADLIVIGTHGRSGINRLLLGSVAEGVVREASVPVLLIRAE
ncbi:MAG: universal stress protein [Methylophilaceae bacterium]|nr:universal stress protein [Methylophilaceae bacterium]